MRRTVRAAAAVFALASLSVSPVLAAAASSKAPCYSVAEFEAEQGIRLHTELMVVGLTCQYLDVQGQPSLFNQYKMFTLKHQERIQNWEKALIGFYKRTGKGNATRTFDSFRTRLANEASQRAIALTTPVFCQNHAPVVARAMVASIEEIQRGFSPDTGDGIRVANAPRCDRPAPPTLVAEAPVPGGRTAAATPNVKAKAAQ